MNIKRHTTDAVIGAFAAVLFMTPVSYFYHKLPHVPYHNVEVVSFTRTPTEVHIKADFEKNGECTFELLKVFVGSLGQYRSVQWYDIDDPSDRATDRLAGSQTLHIAVKYPWGAGADEMEIRTRHRCGSENEKTDYVFLRKELKP